MSDFVWIISSDRQSFLGNGGVSSAYIVPREQMHEHQKTLRGHRIWIVLRGMEDRCLAAISVKKVEKFSEGYHSEDFLISCDLTKSFRLSPAFETAKSYVVPDFSGLTPGIHRFDGKIEAKLEKMVRHAIQFKFSAPDNAVLKAIKFDAVPKRGPNLAKAAISQIVRCLSLDQIWAAGTGLKWEPFGNFAARLLSINGHDPSAQEMLDMIKAHEPIAFAKPTNFESKTETSSNAARDIGNRIDLDFTEIDPTTVYARKFVLSDEGSPDLESALDKTESAEELHQSMLRDISSYLKEKGFSSYESGSIDLMTFVDGRTKIFEIKSATVANILDQGAKGAFQIACYSNAMACDYEPLDAALILHKIENVGLERFISHALNRLKINYLIYDPNREWPHRVSGLLD